MDDQRIGAKEQIAILGLEYNSLRAEINARVGSIYQVVAVFSATSAWMLQQSLGWPLLIGSGMAAVGFSACIWFLARDLIKASFRVQDLEDEINRRAGEKLLIWEKELGGMHHGYFQIRYFFRLLKSRRDPKPTLGT